MSRHFYSLLSWAVRYIKHSCKCVNIFMDLRLDSLFRWTFSLYFFTLLLLLRMLLRVVSFHILDSIHRVQYTGVMSIWLRSEMMDDHRDRRQMTSHKTARVISIEIMTYWATESYRHDGFRICSLRTTSANVRPLDSSVWTI